MPAVLRTGKAKPFLGSLFEFLVSSGPVLVLSFCAVFLYFRWGCFVVVSSGSFFWVFGVWGFLFTELFPIPLWLPHTHIFYPKSPKIFTMGRRTQGCTRSQDDSSQNKNHFLCCRNRLNSGHNNPCWGKFPTLSRAFQTPSAHLSRECQPSFLFPAEHF